METEGRFNSAEARCSGFAAELLRELKTHPHLTEVLAEFEKFDGTIFRSDIESALSAIRKQSGKS